MTRDARTRNTSSVQSVQDSAPQPPALLSERARRRGPRIVVVTGAGISAESGLATYRSGGAGWDDPNLERMARADRYGTFLHKLWPWWGQLRAAAAAAEPNLAHRALVELEELVAAHPGGDAQFVLATQNVDGLHRRAGSQAVVEVHGQLGVSRCMRRACAHRWEDWAGPEPHPVRNCPACGGRARPNIVLFGESLQPEVVNRLRADLAQADLCVYIGTSGTVEPVASWARLAASAGTRCLLLTLEPWPAGGDAFHEMHPGPATQTVPALVRRVRAELGADSAGNGCR